MPLAVNNAAACAAAGNDLLLLDASIPSMRNTCDGVWSGAGQVYVRRATETVLSTSAARPLWGSTRGLDASCSKIDLQVGPLPSQIESFTLVTGDTWYGGTSDALSFIVADANPGSATRGLLPRLNPMAAGTVITANTPTAGLTVVVGGGYAGSQHDRGHGRRRRLQLHRPGGQVRRGLRHLPLTQRCRHHGLGDGGARGGSVRGARH